MSSPPTPSSETSAASPARPHPTQPVAGRTVDDEAPTFDWTPVPDEASYYLQLAPSEHFETLLYNEVVERPATVALTEVLPDDTTTVYWRVRPADGPEASWGSTGHFTTSPDAEAADRLVVDAPPVPLEPTADARVNPAAVSFVWDGVPEASGYQLQVAPSTDFDQPTVDLTLDQVVSITLYDQIPAEAVTQHWRVRCLFPNGTTGPWSRVSAVDVAEDAGPSSLAREAEPETRRAASGVDPIAAGPAKHARTSGTTALVMAVVATVSFILTVALIGFAG